MTLIQRFVIFLIFIISPILAWTQDGNFLSENTNLSIVLAGVSTILILVILVVNLIQGNRFSQVQKTLENIEINSGDTNPEGSIVEAVKETQGVKSQLKEILEIVNDIAQKQPNIQPMNEPDDSISQNTIQTVFLDVGDEANESKDEEDLKMAKTSLEEKINELEQEKKDWLKEKVDLETSLEISEQQVLGFSEKPKILETLSQDYGTLLEFYKSENMKRDIDSFHEHRSSFLIWKDYILTISDTFENDIYGKFIDILEDEKYNIIKDREILFYPFDKNQENYSLNSFGKELIKEENWKKDKIQHLNFARIRKSSDIDYRLDEKEVSPEVVPVLRTALESVLLNIKQLRLFRKKIINLQQNVIEWEANVSEAPQNFELESREIMRILIGEEEEAEKIKKTKELIESGKQLPAENLSRTNNAKQHAEKLQKAYFKFIQQTFLKLADDLNRSFKSNFSITLLEEMQPHKETLTDWEGLFIRLTDLLQGYLKDKLHIEVIETKRGETFEPNIHTSDFPAEPDLELETNQIKSVEGLGFQYEADERRIIIQETKVIVVNNTKK